MDEDTLTVRIEKLLNSLLYDISESFSDYGFNGPIYHYYFKPTAKVKILEFLAHERDGKKE